MLFWDVLIAFCRSVGTICVSAEAFQCAKRCFPFLLRFSDAVCAACERKFGACGDPGGATVHCGNPRHFQAIEGGRKRVSDTFTHKNSGTCL